MIDRIRRNLARGRDELRFVRELLDAAILGIDRVLTADDDAAPAPLPITRPRVGVPTRPVAVERLLLDVMKDGERWTPAALSTRLRPHLARRGRAAHISTIVQTLKGLETRGIVARSGAFGFMFKTPSSASTAGAVVFSGRQSLSGYTGGASSLKGS